MAKSWRHVAKSTTQFKIILLALLLIWMFALGGVITLATLAWESQAVAQPPVRQPSNPGQPMITLTPATGPVSTPVTISGQNWPAGSTVLFYLNPTSVPSTYDFAIDSAVVDPAGRFEATITMPAVTSWPVPGLVRVTARPGNSATAAEAFFSLIELPRPSALPVPEATATPGRVATALPSPGIPRLTANTNLNVRGGPGTNYPTMGLLKTGQNAELTGRGPDGEWWQIRFPAAEAGFAWVNSRYVTVQNIDDIPLVYPQPSLIIVPTTTPVPRPTPSPLIITDWRGEYYDNLTMSGDPVWVRNDVDIDFDWANGVPGPQLPADNFSVRWNRALYFPAGNYRFKVRADDGVMLWIDDNLLIDEWRDSSDTIYQASANLADGMHNLKLAYYERTGAALIELRWEGIDSFPDWKAEYFSNPNLKGNATLIRNDTSLDFNWGQGAPALNLPVDDFSVRWSRNHYFGAGTYRINLTADDGVRLWLDDRLVIDQWRDGSPTTHVVEVSLPEGERNVRLEYYERQGGAVVQLDWSRVESYPDWKAEYFDNRQLKGNPVLVRNDHSIDFNWGKSAPASGLPADSFSVRWSRMVDLPAGTYLIKAEVDDGVRIWLDDVRIIDSWQDGSLRRLESSQKISGGRHRVTVEYYDRSGHAQVQVSWQIAPVRADNQPPQAILPENYQGSEGSPLQFDGRTSFDADGTITRYEWDFDYNGSSFNVDATGPMPTFTYLDGPATYTVALRVSDEKSETGLATALVAVQNLSPVVQAGGPYSGLVGQPITLSGVAVDPAAADQDSLIFEWDLGEGSQASGPVVGHVYPTPGTHLARLTVSDKDGGQQTATTTVSITSPNEPPQAVISGPATALIGNSVFFSGIGSNDPDGSIVDFTWNLAGEIVSGPEVTAVFTTAGSHPISLTVVDDHGLTATIQHTIEIRDGESEPPVEAPENLPL